MSYQKCPVCNGTGTTLTGVYSTTQMETCPTCKGQRIISELTGKPPTSDTEEEYNKYWRNPLSRDTSNIKNIHDIIDTQDTLFSCTKERCTWEIGDNKYLIPKSLRDDFKCGKCNQKVFKYNIYQDKSTGCIEIDNEETLFFKKIRRQLKDALEELNSNK